MELLQSSATCVVKVDGKEIKNDISLVQIDSLIDNHHQLEVKIRQVGKATQASDFDDPSGYTAFLGKSISVNIKPAGGLVEAAREMEFVGLVTKVSIDNSIDGLNTVRVTGHSPTIALDGAKHNAFYFDDTAGNVIGSLLRKYAVTLGTIEATKRTYKFLVQYRETDYEFIMRMAADSGKFAYYDGKEFRLTKASGSEVEELVWRETLGSFAYGLGTAAPEFESTTYNYEQKKDFSQDSKNVKSQAALSAMSKTSPDASAAIFKNAGFSTAPKFVPDAQTLDDILANERGHAYGGMIYCEGISIVPKVAVGHCVRIKGMNKLDGTFWVKQVRHVFDESGKYSNRFICTPLDIAYPATRAGLPPFTELQSAVVADNNDPDKLGRLKVKFPWANGDTVWVRFLSPHAGSGHGWYVLPEIGDEVLIGFDQGNPDMPVALGALYNNVDAPESSAVNADNNIKLFKTKGGNQIYLKDEGGKEEIKLIMAGQGGKNSLVMSLDGTPSITIESDGNINIKGNNVTIEGKQKVEIKASTDFNAEGTNMKIKANANLDIEGTMVNVKGSMINLN